MFYQMWIGNHSSSAERAAYQQAEAEREADLAALIAAHTETGVRPLIYCESGWANERHPFWGVTAFPNLEARIQQHQKMHDFGFYRSNEATFSLLGTAIEPPALENIQPGLVYSLWVVRSEPAAGLAYNALSEEKRSEGLQKVESEFHRLGGCWIIRCNSYWANDAYRQFGVETFPNLEALQEYKATLEKMDWPTYVPAMSILGTLSPLMEQIKPMFG